MQPFFLLAVSSLGLSPFQRSSPLTFIFYSFWLELACGPTKTVPETSAQCRKEAPTEVVNKIIGRPCATKVSVGFWHKSCHQMQLYNGTCHDKACHHTQLVTCPSLIGVWYESAGNWFITVSVQSNLSASDNLYLQPLPSISITASAPPRIITH